MNAANLLARIQFLGSVPARFGVDENGDVVTVERYYRAGGVKRAYRVVRVRENGFTVSLDTMFSQLAADHVARAAVREEKRRALREGAA